MEELTYLDNSRSHFIAHHTYNSIAKLLEFHLSQIKPHYSSRPRVQDGAGKPKGNKRKPTQTMQDKYKVDRYLTTGS